MYSQQELDDAVASGVITADAANALRAHVEGQRSTAIPDEEQFRLITGFNDIFVSIAAAILLFAVGWIGQSIGQTRRARDRRRRTLASLAPLFVASDLLGAGAVLHRQAADGAALDPVAAGLRRRRLGDGRLRLVLAIGDRSASTIIRSSAAWSSAISAAIARGGRLASLAPLPRADHRRRRRGVGRRRSRSACSIAALGQNAENAKNLILGFVLLLGIGVFLFAMWWDGSDRARLTRRSDVAFWLHLLAAPMIVHPVFTLLGLNDGHATIGEGVVVILLYVALGADGAGDRPPRAAGLGAGLCAVRAAAAVPPVRRGRAQRRADRAGHRLGPAAAVGLLAPGARRRSSGRCRRALRTGCRSSIGPAWLANQPHEPALERGQDGRKLLAPLEHRAMLADQRERPLLQPKLRGVFRCGFRAARSGGGKPRRPRRRDRSEAHNRANDRPRPCARRGRGSASIPCGRNWQSGAGPMAAGTAR